jgi:hypothetical protein
MRSAGELDNLQIGGNTRDLKKLATGSFPPLYIVPKKEQSTEEENKSRAVSKINKTAISIKDIMQERRDDIKPFITL